MATPGAWKLTRARTGNSFRNSRRLQSLGGLSKNMSDSNLRESEDEKVDGEKYMFGDILGRGGFGIVYKAINMENGQMVAIKQFKAVASQETIEEAKKEISVLKSLDSEFIVKYYECFHVSSQLNVVLEYIEGGSLCDILKRFGVFPENLARHYTGQIIHGMEYLHESNVIHRDIKCGNVLLTKDGGCKLADFGTSVIFSKEKKTLHLEGSPFWMAPEALVSDLSFAMDIWSLASTVVEMITGHPPYWELGAMAAMYRLTEDEHPPIPDNISEELEHFFHCCFQKEKRLRYTSAQLLQHPWILGETQSRGRTFTAAEVGEVLSSHSERKLTTSDLLSYEESIVLGSDFDIIKLGALLDTLDNEPDPIPQIAISYEAKASEDLLDQQPVEIKAYIQQLREENEELKRTSVHNQRLLGCVLNTKKKGLLIAKKYRQQAEIAEARWKETAAQLQSFHDHKQKYEDEQISKMLRRNKKLANGMRWMSEHHLIDIGVLLKTLFNGSLSTASVRAKSIEGKMDVLQLILPKATKRLEQSWLMLCYNFLLVYEKFDAEVPQFIIPLHLCKILPESKAMSTFMTSHEEYFQQKKSRRKKRPSADQTPQEDYSFYIQYNNTIYGISSTLPNLRQMWHDNCKTYTMWYNSIPDQPNR